jgi:uncharacterized membrane protein YhiD involved in acid resistance
MEWAVLKIILAGVVGSIIGLVNKYLNSLEESARVFAIISMGAALTSIVSIGHLSLGVFGNRVNMDVRKG